MLLFQYRTAYVHAIEVYILISGQRCTLLSSNSMVIAHFMSGKGRYGRPLKTTPKKDRSTNSCKNLCAILLLDGTAIHPGTVSMPLSKELGLKSHTSAFQMAYLAYMY